MSEMTFGLPNLRSAKKEKYENEGCITFMPVEKEGAGRKMVLNKYAIDLLNLTDKNNQVSFSFSGTDTYIVNTSGNTGVSGLKVGKTTNGFSDKKQYNFIKQRQHNMADEEMLELFFEETSREYNSYKVYKLVSKSNTIENEVVDMLSMIANAPEADENDYQLAKEIDVTDAEQVDSVKQ